MKKALEYGGVCGRNGNFMVAQKESKERWTGRESTGRYVGENLKRERADEGWKDNGRLNRNGSIWDDYKDFENAGEESGGSER